ncbi:MAG: helix-hairpin-helix domain-containing protein [Saprospiraceae bacterium]
MNNILLQICNPLDLSCFWFWLLLSLLAFLLGWLLHWLLSRGVKAQLEAALMERDKAIRERDDYHKQYTTLKADFDKVSYELEQCRKTTADLRSRLANSDADRQVLKTKLAKLESDDEPTTMDTKGLGILSGAAAGAAAGSRKVGFGGLFANDYLQIIEGVGPKIEALLKANGYSTWAAVAAAPVAGLQEILTTAGSRYALAKPDTWPKQAQFATDGDWKGLIAYQQTLDTGVVKAMEFSTPSKFEKLAAKAMGFSSTNPEDLKVVEGIGPKIEGLLKAAGINNWRELAGTTVDRIKAILDEAGDRYRLASPDTWPRQAELAADGKWQELNEYQDFLQGGK